METPASEGGDSTVFADLSTNHTKEDIDAEMASDGVHKEISNASAAPLPEEVLATTTFTATGGETLSAAPAPCSRMLLWVLSIYALWKSIDC